MANPTEVFLRGIWRSIIPRTDDLSWVSRVAALPPSDEPLGDYGTLVRRMLDAGLSAEELARFAQLVGYQAAAGLCYYLGDPYWAYEGTSDGGQDEVAWGLFLVDPDSGDPREPLSMLHESILSMDPSGREMRPDLGGPVIE